MGCTLIRSPTFEGTDARLASVPTDNGANAFALGGHYPLAATPRRFEGNDEGFKTIARDARRSRQGFFLSFSDRRFTCIG
jgi:hypothetical protein